MRRAILALLILAGCSHECHSTARRVGPSTLYCHTAATLRIQGEVVYCLCPTPTGAE